MSGYAISIASNGRSSYRAVASDADLLTGETFASEPPAPTLADAAAALSAAVQSWLDQTAQANGYDSLFTCISYRGSSVAGWDADAVHAMAWRDAVWQAAFAWQQAAASSTPAAIPTAAQVIAQLPQPEQFGWIAHAPGA